MVGTAAAVLQALDRLHAGRLSDPRHRWRRETLAVETMTVAIAVLAALRRSGSLRLHRSERPQANVRSVCLVRTTTAADLRRMATTENMQMRKHAAALAWGLAALL